MRLAVQQVIESPPELSYTTIAKLSVHKSNSLWQYPSFVLCLMRD